MSVQTVFDKYACDYDRARRQLIPCFDEFYGAVPDLVPFGREAEIQVLDLGAGTGLLSMFIATAFPRAEITLVDISQEMLSRARTRLAGVPAPVHFLLRDYAREPICGHYHAVVSALSIHHLSEADKSLLFQKIFDALRPGGVFVNADQVRGPTAAIEERYHTVWLRQVMDSGIAESDLAAAQARMKEDRTSTLSDQLWWLSQCGFQMVNCWYKNYMFAVYGGQKPPQRTGNE